MPAGAGLFGTSVRGGNRWKPGAGPSMTFLSWRSEVVNMTATSEYFFSLKLVLDAIRDSLATSGYMYICTSI